MGLICRSKGAKAIKRFDSLLVGPFLRPGLSKARPAPFKRLMLGVDDALTGPAVRIFGLCLFCKGKVLLLLCAGFIDKPIYPFGFFVAGLAFL